jgi:hypothetical protein
LEKAVERRFKVVKPEWRRDAERRIAGTSDISSLDSNPYNKITMAWPTRRMMPRSVPGRTLKTTSRRAESTSKRIPPTPLPAPEARFSVERAEGPIIFRNSPT